MDKSSDRRRRNLLDIIIIIKKNLFYTLSLRDTYT